MASTNPNARREELSSPRFRFEWEQGGIAHVALEGDWTLGRRWPSPEQLLEDLASGQDLRGVRITSEKLSGWNSALLVFVRRLQGVLQKQHITLDDAGLPAGARRLLRLAAVVPSQDDSLAAEDQESLLGRIGSASLEAVWIGYDVIGFLGDVVISSVDLLRGRVRFRISDLTLYLQEAGAQALPIVSLISFLIGLILAFVGGIQLERFGATIFVVDLVTVAMVRELAPMMTAIVLAGRTGAAYAAQLGTMMVNEEIDAFRAFRVSVIGFLVLPRLLALTLMVPLLALYADFVGILGGAVVAVTTMDISLIQFIEQAQKAVTPFSFLLGLIKATIYGGLVAFAGTYQGIRCGRSAAAVGAATTSAVVSGIVMIVVASAITTVVYDALGW